MNHYSKYKSSGVDWLTQIPSHWTMSKTKYVFKYTTGFTPSSGQDEFYNGDLTWVTITDMNQKIVSESQNALSRLAVERYKPEITKKGSLLFSFKLSVGKVAYAGKDLYTNEAIISISPDQNYDVRYFYYALPEQLLQNANENIYGAKILNQDLIKNAYICIPPKQEQTAIANFLEEKTAAIDKLISNKKKLIELLREERTAIINEAVSGEGKNWEKKKLKYVVDNFDSLRVPLNATQRDGGKKYDYYGASGIIDKVAEYIFDGDYILIGEDGANLLTRSTALAFKASGKFWVNNHAHILKPKNGDIDFFTYLLESLDYTAWVTGSAQPKLTAENLMNITLQVPSLKEQQEIVHRLQTETMRIDATISKIIRDVNLLDEYRTALISEVVTGKIKVV